ncbi:glycosyltransferase, partial [Paraherbaspirillum soli]
MRLLIFIYSLEMGGAERVTTNLANHWVARGWEITIVTLASTSTDFYKLPPGIKRVAFELTGDSGNLLTRFSRNIRRVKELRRTLREIQPDVALAMMSTANVILSLAARRFPNVCAIGSEHTFPPQLPLGAIWEALRHKTYGQLAAVVALTQECAHWIGAHTSARRVSVIPNPACWPLPEHVPKKYRSEVCAPERQLLLAVGRLNKEKNFELLVEVFSHLAQKHPDWDLVILGEGPERQVLEAQLKAKGLDKRVFLPGRIGNVGEWYQQADLYVM